MQAVCCSTAHLPVAATLAWRQPAAASHARPVLHARPQRLPRRLLHVANASESTQAPPPEPEDDEEMGVLLPEEDWEVPGTYQDAMKAGTKLGKAVAGACDELDLLGSLETEVLNEAQQLLQRVGFKGSLFQAPPPQPEAADPPAEASSA